MEQLGRLTLPTDADVVEETLRLKNLLGADALRDCDGTEMPAELLQDPAKKYATTTRCSVCRARSSATSSSSSSRKSALLPKRWSTSSTPTARKR